MTHVDLKEPQNRFVTVYASALNVPVIAPYVKAFPKLSQLELIHATVKIYHWVICLLKNTEPKLHSIAFLVHR